VRALNQRGQRPHLFQRFRGSVEHRRLTTEV
jgi:hypothetical protein